MTYQIRQIGFLYSSDVGNQILAIVGDNLSLLWHETYVDTTTIPNANVNRFLPFFVLLVGTVLLLLPMIVIIAVTHSKVSKLLIIELFYWKLRFVCLELSSAIKNLIVFTSSRENPAVTFETDNSSLYKNAIEENVNVRKLSQENDTLMPFDQMQGCLIHNMSSNIVSKRNELFQPTTLSNFKYSYIEPKLQTSEPCNLQLIDEQTETKNANREELYAEEQLHQTSNISYEEVIPLKYGYSVTFPNSSHLSTHNCNNTITHRLKRNDFIAHRVPPYESLHEQPSCEQQLSQQQLSRSHSNAQMDKEGGRPLRRTTSKVSFILND